jgi:RNA polymerase sigma factor (TIGR02999 family)
MISPSAKLSPNMVQPGESEPAENLLPMVYAELRHIALARLASEAPGHTLQATALVHEAWIKLGGEGRRWTDQRHFVAAAAESMRRILIDRARKRRRERHGGGMEKVDLDKIDLAANSDDESLLQLDEALERFAKVSPEKAELVKLRFFTGLSIAEAAEAMAISPATAKRHWIYARAWLYAELRNNEAQPGAGFPT